MVRTGKPRKISPFGVLVHVTGRGVIHKAVEWGCSPLEAAVKIYREGSAFPHAVIGWAGEIVEICDPGERGAHARWEDGEYGDGWQAPAWWMRYWHPRGAKTPRDIVPERYGGPNGAYVGVELLSTSDVLPTAAQYDALAAYAKAQAARFGLALAIHEPNFLGHEDLCPDTRSDKGGGWDPGALREAPRFEWAKVIV